MEFINFKNIQYMPKDQTQNPKVIDLKKLNTKNLIRN